MTLKNSKPAPRYTKQQLAGKKSNYSMLKCFIKHTEDVYIFF